MIQRLKNFLYNFDRALASLFLGAPAQETISSMAGRAKDKDAVAAELCRALNAIDPGHCEHALSHADRLEHADDGQEK